MTPDIPKTNELESMWKKEKTWRLSRFVRDFLRRAKAKYPKPEYRSKAAWPSDEEGIAQNLTFLFPGHMFKVSKCLCEILGDEEASDFLTHAGEIVVLDMACGTGMGSVATTDYLIQVLKAGHIKRETPLVISFIVNDLNAACVEATIAHLEIVRTLLPSYSSQLRVGSLDSFTGSIGEILPFFERTRSKMFNFFCFSNAFDHVLLHGHLALEKNPSCSDPIAHVPRHKRSPLLADFFLKLGAYADPYFARALLLQENRYSPLLPLGLPSDELKVVRTWQRQEVLRPDVDQETMNVRFGYCACQYRLNGNMGEHRADLVPLPRFRENASFFTEESFEGLGFDDETSGIEF